MTKQSLMPDRGIADAPSPTHLGPDQVVGGYRPNLVALAAALLEDPDLADEVVADVVADIHVLPGIPRQGPQLWQELARLVYLRCVGTADPPSRTPVDLEPDPLVVMARLRELSEQQRAAIALVLYGDHTHRQVSELLGVSTSAVAELVCCGLRDLRP